MKILPPDAAVPMLGVGSSAYILDDDEAVLSSLRFVLGTEGIRVRLFESPAALLSEHSIASKTCLLLSYRLKDTNGLELVRRLRARGLSAPAILMAEQVDAKLKRRAAEAGLVVLEKSDLSDTVTAAIHRVLA